MSITNRTDETKQLKSPKAKVIRTSIILMLFLAMCGWTYITLFGEFELPDCNKLLIEKSYIECHWEIDIDEDNNFIKIRLIVDGREGAFIELGVLDVSMDSTFADAPYQRGWIGIIGVDSEFQNIGLGTTLWRLGDQAIRHTFGANQVRIYTNASQNNPAFAFKIKSNVQAIWETSSGDFIYIIR